MNVRRLGGLTLVLAAALAVGPFVTAGDRPGDAPAPPANGKEPPGKGKRAREFIAAFEKGDAHALAGFWTEDGDYVDDTGRDYKGRAAIEKMYEKFFAGKKGLELNVLCPPSPPGFCPVARRRFACIGSERRDLPPPLALSGAARDRGTRSGDDPSESPAYEFADD